MSGSSRLLRIFFSDTEPVEIATTMVDPVFMEDALNGAPVDRADITTQDNTIVCYDDNGTRGTCPDPTEHVIPNGHHHPTLNPHNFDVFNRTNAHFITNSITKNGRHNWQINISEEAVVREPLRNNTDDAEIATATAAAPHPVDHTVLQRFVPKKTPHCECQPCDKCRDECYRRMEEEDGHEAWEQRKLRDYEEAWAECEVEQERKRMTEERRDFNYEQLEEARQWVV